MAVAASIAPPRTPDAASLTTAVQGIADGPKPANATRETLVRAFVERSKADLGWLAWQDGTDPVVVERLPTGPLHPSVIVEFPEPPHEPLMIERGRGSGPWALWCHGRGIRACIVVPIRSRNKIVGTIGLVSCSFDALTDDDLQRLQLLASLALSARRHEARLAGLRQLFDEVSRTLENALALDRALKLPPTYRDIARSVGESLDASDCQIAIREAEGALTVDVTEPIDRRGVLVGFMQQRGADQHGAIA